MNVVAITTYSNPDLLWIYLDQISGNSFAQNFKYRLFTEVGYNQEINDVVKEFSFLDINLKVRKKHPKCPLVGYYNILESYRDAAEETDEYVIVGEDDLIPTKDYLKFNDYVYRNFLAKYERIFCVGHKRRPENEIPGNSEVLIGDYQMTSPSCVSKKNIEKYLLPHLNDNLYDDPPAYYFRNFGDSRINPFTEVLHHDGFIERVMWKSKLFGLKPDQAISGHLGLRGIHSKGNAPEGNLEKRIDSYRTLMQDGEKLRSLSSMPQDLVVAPDWIRDNWKSIELDTERNKAIASSWWYDTENNFKKYINEGL